MADTLMLGQTLVTKVPEVLLDPTLKPGKYRVRLVVSTPDGDSDPAEMRLVVLEKQVTTPTPAPVVPSPTHVIPLPTPVIPLPTPVVPVPTPGPVFGLRMTAAATPAPKTNAKPKAKAKAKAMAKVKTKTPHTPPEKPRRK